MNKLSYFVLSILISVIVVMFIMALRTAPKSKAIVKETVSNIVVSDATKQPLEKLFNAVPGYGMYSFCYDGKIILLYVGTYKSSMVITDKLCNVDKETDK